MTGWACRQWWLLPVPQVEGENDAVIPKLQLAWRWATGGMHGTGGNHGTRKICEGEGHCVAEHKRRTPITHGYSESRYWWQPAAGAGRRHATSEERRTCGRVGTCGGMRRAVLQLTDAGHVRSAAWPLDNAGQLQRSGHVHRHRCMHVQCPVVTWQ